MAPRDARGAGDADYRAALAPVPRSDLTLAAFVCYGETPAGDYDKILATPVVLLQAPMPAGTIPFIAVDSLASIVAGRANRALPKTWRASTVPTWSPIGDGWSVAARIRPRGPALPFAVLASNRPVAADGTELAVRIRARLGRATVHFSAPELPPLAARGQPPGDVMTRAWLHFSQPRNV